MLYIEVENSKIKSIYSGKMPEPAGRDLREVPMMFSGVVGQDIREFSPEWDLLPLEVRLRAKLIPDSERYKAMGEELVPKTPEELVRDGIEPAPCGMKLDPTAPFEAPRFVPMTREELVLAGALTADEAKALDVADAIASLTQQLYSTDWYVVRKSETGADIPEVILLARAEARDKISALRVTLTELQK